MQFTIASAQDLKVSDAELSRLLLQVYVKEGFVSEEVAAVHFAATQVRKRGLLFCAREQQSSVLAGMVIVVPSDSEASVLAAKNEAEIHLLAVQQGYRGNGLGRLLVDTALTYATQQGYTKMLLRTQQPMTAAQQLYESSGFHHTMAMRRSGIDFLVYEKNIS